MFLWIIICGVLSASLMLTYEAQANDLKSTINNLHRYSLTENAVVKIQMYTQLSLNMLNYWNSTDLAIIHS